MNRVGVGVLAAGVVVLVACLLWPIYIEPGQASSIDCGNAWDPAPMEPFLEAECRRSIAQRREVMVIPVFLVVAGSAMVVVASRRGTHGSRPADT